MTLEKAIEILSKLLADRQDLATLDLGTAVKLGIEALKYHLYRRKTVDAVGSPLLPGETKD